MLEFLKNLCEKIAFILHCLFLDQGGQSRRFSQSGLGFEKKRREVGFFKEILFFRILQVAVPT